MKYILSPTQMRKADSIAINDYNIPSIILMENAARSASQIIKQLYYENKIPYNNFVFFCGSGNNGGDGYALARHLFEDFDIKIYWVGSEDKMSLETRTNFQAIKRINLPIIHIGEDSDIDKIDLENKCIIDALIGVGGSENIKKPALNILKKAESSKSYKIAIDAPTGLNTETGIANHHCIRADITITMFAIKIGMLINDGPEVCGKIYVANLGAPLSIIKELSKIYILEHSDIKKNIPIRRKRTNKFDYGKVVILAGSRRFPGAASLTANATIKTGAGLVYLLSPLIHNSLLPEVIPQILPTTDEGTISLNAYDSIMNEINKANVLAIGPGLGDNTETTELIQRIFENTSEKIPIVIDADGLRFINSNSKLRKNIIITPHSGEFSRILNINRKEIELNSLNYAIEYAKKSNCIVLLKNVPSIISDGNISYLNTNGNPGMASGGSGDVLTGIIAGLLAIGLSPIDASSVGAFIHSDAADFYSSHFAQETLSASSLLDSLVKVFPK